MRRRYRSRNGHTTGEANYIKVEAHGYLIRWADSNSAIVIGYTRVSPKTFIINGLFLLAFTLILSALTLAFLLDFLFLAPLIIFVLFSFAYTTLYQPESLANKQKRTLARQIDRILRQPGISSV